MQIISSAFEYNAKIPVKYTCGGENTNPPLRIMNVPPDAKSMVLIVEDPDAPQGSFVHWLLWNIDPKVHEITEDSVPNKAVQGLNGKKTAGYTGPCPHSDTHRYFFRIYALDTNLNLKQGADRTELESAMKDYVIDQANLIGQFSRA